MRSTISTSILLTPTRAQLPPLLLVRLLLPLLDPVLLPVPMLVQVEAEAQVVLEGSRPSLEDCSVLCYLALR